MFALGSWARNRGCQWWPRALISFGPGHDGWRPSLESLNWLGWCPVRFGKPQSDPNQIRGQRGTSHDQRNSIDHFYRSRGKAYKWLSCPYVLSGTLKQLVLGWKNSSGHKRPILMDKIGEFSWKLSTNSRWLEFLFWGDFSWTLFWWIFVDTFLIVMIWVTLLQFKYFLT